jgi:hypothetical protein
MAHNHSVYDNDTHFVIDPAANMAITTEAGVKALKQGDHAAERFSFKMPRYIEGHDMSLCNKVEAHYNNVKYDSTTRETTTIKSFDEVDDFGVSANEDEVEWSWLIKGDATQQDGTLAFCFRFACMNGDVIEYQKFTDTFGGVPVGASIFNTESVAKEYADILETWRQEIIAQCGTGGSVSDEQIAAAVEAYMIKNPVEGGTDVWFGSVAQYEAATIPAQTLCFITDSDEAPEQPDEPDQPVQPDPPEQSGVEQIGSVLYVYSGVTVAQSGDALTIGG